MTFTLIYIRYLQIIRALKDGGIGSILLPFVIAALSFGSFKAYQNLNYGLLLVAVLLFFCLALQVSRKDKNFAQLHLENWHWQMYAEYVLLTLPFTITAIFTRYYFYFPMLLVLFWFVPLWQFKPIQKTSFKNISTLLPAAYFFEWISGFRKSFLGLIPLYVIAIATCWIRFLPLLLLWFMITNIINFYNEFEPIHILKANHNNAKDFLNQKLKKHGIYICLLFVPVLILNSIFHPDFIEINCLFLGIQLALLAFAICFKYNSYVPQQKNSASNITLGIVSMACLIPFLLPLPILFSLVYYKKAVQNLNLYFNDKD